MERLLRKPEARRCFAVGKTTFEERIVPRLDKVYVGPRTVTFTQTSVERLLEELKAESATYSPAPIDHLRRRRDTDLKAAAEADAAPSQAPKRKAAKQREANTTAT